MSERTKQWRMAQEERVKAKRMGLAKDLGLQGGLVYEKHCEKIERSSGYVKDGGNIRHYVACKPRGYPYKRKSKYKEF